MKRYGIIINELTDENPGTRWGPFFLKHHKEEEIVKFILSENNFSIGKIVRAILEGIEDEKR